MSRLPRLSVGVVVVQASRLTLEAVDHTYIHVCLLIYPFMCLFLCWFIYLYS